MSKSMKIAVAGATGRLGRHVVEVLNEQGHEVVAFSRANGVDIETGAGLVEALDGVQVVIDTSSTPSADQRIATEFFTASAHNLHEAGSTAGVERLIAVSIVGIDKSEAGYNAAKLAHERALLDGPLPTQILRAAQFHELVEVMLGWGTQGDVAYLPNMRTQLVAARTVAEALVDLAVRPAEIAVGPFLEVAGPQPETMAGAAALLAERLGNGVRVVEVSDPENPDREQFEDGTLLPGAHAYLAGPTFAEWARANHLV
ncbi:NAD(P)H-binding protein [Nocardia uniformis]|uniref:NAD(P)H-binding protein n=1 Tax=Nocardia uniformis TaxID=53432 RepID=A0A849CCP2_9NOCA|nr:NAD(P)H-binding protein [Nocardia uniformis]NNH75528.1 NAD(P)H-binding protein [Nocardia uniformis]